MELLVVVDMQKDFIDGALGTKEAMGIVSNVAEEIQNWPGEVVYTMDTHGENYLDTQEGRNLPVVHCVKGSEGWQLDKSLQPLVQKMKSKVFEKPTFGSEQLAGYIKELYTEKGLTKVMLIGLCTDICVISNAMLMKAAVPELEVVVKESCCAGVTPESHNNALSAMKMCQIQVIE